MGVFKVLPKVGLHVERDASGVEYEYGPGCTLESDRNLVELFPNKFVRIDTELAPGGNVPQPNIPVPHRFIKNDEIVSPAKTTGDAKVGEAGDAKVETKTKTEKKKDAALETDSKVGKS